MARIHTAAWSLADRQQHIEQIYGPRLGTADPFRVSAYLVECYVMILKSHRYVRTQECMPLALAYTAATVLILCNRMQIDLRRVMARKYPGACLYCKRVVCSPECVHRPHGEVIPGEPASALLQQSLSAWQEMLRNTFHASNLAQGLDEVVYHLGDEVMREVTGALLDLIEHRRPELTDDALLDRLGLECADVLAWTIAVSNFHEADLAYLLDHYFAEGCPACGQLPCIGRNAMCLAHYPSPSSPPTPP